jgi:cell wall assembly regulator SMI1
LGLELLETKEILSNLEFSLSLAKPTDRKIVNPDKAEEIAREISDLYLKSIPVKKSFGVFSKKWVKAIFDCSGNSHSGISVEYKDGSSEYYDLLEEYSSKIVELANKIYLLEKEDYNWDDLKFELFPDGKYKFERKDYDWEEETTFSSCPEGKIKKKVSNHKWIPILHDAGGNFIGIDLDPDTYGVKGQVIIFGRDEYKRVVIADSFEEFLDLTIMEINNNPNQFKSDTHIYDVYKEIKNCADW